MDGLDKEGNEVLSEESEDYDDEKDYGEEEGDFIDEDELDSETRKKLNDQLGGDDDDDEEYDEEYDDEEEDGQG